MNEPSHKSITPEHAAEREINLLELFRVLVRRRMVMVKICSVAIVLSIGLSLVMKNVYTATSTILPPPREYSIGGGGGAGGLSASAILTGGGALVTAHLELYVTIFKSRNVLDAVIQRLDLQKVLKAKNLEAARKRVKNSVKFKSGKDGTITVSASNRDPQLAAQLVNTFVEEMSRRSSQLYITKAGTERSFLEKRLLEVRKELTVAEDALRAFQEKNKTLRADGQASIAVEGIARLRLEIVNREVQLATLRNSMTDESNEVKALQAAIAGLKRQMGAMSGSGGANSYIPAAGNVPGIMSEFLRLVREVKILETVFEQLSKQHELAKINESRDSGTVQVIDEAIPPVTKSSPKRSLIVIVAAFAAFFISIVTIFVQEYLSKLSTEDAEIVKEIRQSLCFWKRRS
jgi:uncharacterized protein involved in exopolysaccharide biosynthesis